MTTPLGMAAVEYFLNDGGSSDGSNYTKPAPVVVHKGHKFCNGTCQRHRAPHSTGSASTS